MALLGALHSCSLSSEDPRALGKGRSFHSSSKNGFSQRQRHASYPHLSSSLSVVSLKNGS